MSLYRTDPLTDDMTKTSKYTVIIEKDEDGMYVAKVPDIPGCYTQAKTVP